MKHVKRKIRFLLLPKFYYGKTYWLTWVRITKHFNGYRYLTTNIEKLQLCRRKKRKRLRKENYEQLKSK